MRFPTSFQSLHQIATVKDVNCVSPQKKSSELARNMSQSLSISYNVASDWADQHLTSLKQTDHDREPAMMFLLKLQDGLVLWLQQGDEDSISVKTKVFEVFSLICPHLHYFSLHTETHTYVVCKPPHTYENHYADQPAGSLFPTLCQTTQPLPGCDLPPP